jgi:hypothetical protein
VDEVANVQAIAYDKKRQLVVKTSGKRRRITLYSVGMIIIEETMLDA